MQYIQGDVMFIPEKLDSSSGNIKENTNVIAEGEKTGHKHILSGGYIFHIIGSGMRYAFVEEGGGAVTHDEHPPLKLDHGVYRIVRQRTFDYKSTHQKEVID